MVCADKLNIPSMSEYCFFIQFQQRFPFDWKNPTGFLVAIFIQYILVVSVMISLKCLVIFEIGLCFMLFPMTKDIKCNLNAINARPKKNRSKIDEKFPQVVQFHCKLIQLSYANQFFQVLVEKKF